MENSRDNSASSQTSDPSGQSAADTSRTDRGAGADHGRPGESEEFPGYPHYAPEDDITAAGEKVSADMEGVSRANNQTAAGVQPAQTDATVRNTAQASNASLVGANEPRQATDDADNSGRPQDDVEADVTNEELMLLDQADRGLDDSDDAQAPMRAQLDETDEDGDPLNEAAGREGLLGDDIDVPGSEADDANEAMGEEDEENNYYSLGGDEKSSLDDSNEGSINRI